MRRIISCRRLVALISVLALSLPGDDAPAADDLSTLRAVAKRATPVQTALQQRWARILTDEKIIADNVVGDYISRLIDRLAPDEQIIVRVSSQNTNNAFAFYRGVIIFHAGIIAFFENERELLGVLAHEIAHITQGHAERQHRSMKTDALLSALLLGAGAASDQPALTYGSIGLLQSRALAYSRELEHEADVTAYALLQQRNLPTDGLHSFFHRLPASASSYHATHPSPQSRRGYLLSRDTSEPESSPPVIDFLLLQTAVQLAATNKSSQLRRQWQRMLEDPDAVTSEEQIQAAYGLLRLANSRHQPADDATTALLAQYADDSFFITMAMIDALAIRFGVDDTRVIEKINDARKKYPDSIALTKRKLAGADEAREIIAILHRLDATGDRQSALYKTAARAVTDPILANALLVQGHYLDGDFELGYKQLAILRRLLSQQPTTESATQPAMQSLRDNLERLEVFWKKQNNR